MSVQISESIDTQEIELTDTLTDTPTDSELTHQNDVQTVSSSNQVIESISVELTITDSLGSVSPKSFVSDLSTVTTDLWDDNSIPTAEQTQIKEKELDAPGGNFQVGDHVFVTSQPHTDVMAPYMIERIEGESAKLECFSQLIPLAELRK